MALKGPIVPGDILAWDGRDYRVLLSDEDWVFCELWKSDPEAFSRLRSGVYFRCSVPDVRRAFVRSRGVLPLTEGERAKHGSDAPLTLRWARRDHAWGEVVWDTCAEAELALGACVSAVQGFVFASELRLIGADGRMFVDVGAGCDCYELARRMNNLLVEEGGGTTRGMIVRSGFGPARLEYMFEAWE